MVTTPPPAEPVRKQARRKGPGNFVCREVVALMELADDVDQYMPNPPASGLANFETVSSPGQGCVVRARRPLTVNASAFVTQVVDELADAGRLDSAFKASDAPIVDELLELYAVAEKTAPDLLTQFRFTHRLPNKSAVKRELRASVTPMMPTVAVGNEMHELCKKLFGFGLGVLTAPIHFLHAAVTTKQSMATTRGLLAQAKSATQPSVLVVDPTVKAPVTPLAATKPSTVVGPVAPPTLALPYMMVRQDGWLWVPARQKWHRIVASGKNSPPIPVEQYVDACFEDWVWSASFQEWMRVVVEG